MKEKILYPFMSSAKDIVDKAYQDAGKEVNPILKIFKNSIGWVLVVAGIIGVFWFLGQLRQGNSALMGIIFSIVSLISGVILINMEIMKF